MTNPDPIWIFLGASIALAGAITFLARLWVRRETVPLPVVLGRLAETDEEPAEPARPPLLDLTGVSKSYRDAAGNVIPILRNVTLTIGDGMTAIIGPSGRGKSTLLNLLGGLDPVYEGVIRFRGVELPKVEGPALRTYRREKIGFVFQELNLITHLTAVENVALPLLCRNAGRAETLAKARANLRAVGLEERADQKPAKLSGGERQRVAITRAFTADAEFILADEPTGSLDPRNARLVMNLFATLARQKNRPVILVTHDEELAKAYCDRILRCTENGIEDVTPRPELPELLPPPPPPRRTSRIVKGVRLVPNGRTGELRVRLVLRDQENGRTRREEDRS